MSETAPSIGLVGLGLLGTAISERLLGSGFSLLGYDLDTSRCEALVERGGEAADRPASVLDACDTIILSLPDSDVVAKLLEHNRRSLRRAQTLLDTTTGEPQAAEELASQLAARGLLYVDATVAGSSEQVRRGEACLFVGGDEDRLQGCRDVLDAISPRRFYLGNPGAASRFKLVHNLALGLHRAVLAETLRFGEAQGFEVERTLQILRQTPAASEVMRTKGQKMVLGDYAPQATLAQHLKDVRLLIREAERCGMEPFLSRVHAELLERAERAGFGAEDNAAVIEAYDRPRSTPGGRESPAAADSEPG